MKNRFGDMRDAALSYLALGWSVIPLLPGEKRPLAAWIEFQQRLATRDEVAAWFRDCPSANIAIVTGTVSGIVVLDVDIGHGGAQSLARLESGHGRLPLTLEAITGGGGRHLYFAHPGGLLHNRTGIEPGLDLRGDGGYIVAPPSLHPSGVRYRWVPGRAPAECVPAPIPDWLLPHLAAGGERHGPPVSHWRQLVREGVAQGTRNSTIASIAGHLLWHGVDPEVVLDLMLCWNERRCRPPLSDDEVARTVGSIVRTQRRHIDPSHE